jgi:uncharacterized protein YdaU (DUF1376 family)
MTIGSNGGPPLADDVPQLSYFKFYPSDFLAGTADMTAEERGIYITALCVMYDRMGGMPFDERKGAPLMRVDIRVYRRVRDKLLEDGKFVRDGDLIRNMRVEKEITDYVREYKRRSEAAKKREAERRLHRTSDELQANLSETSSRSSAEVSKKSVELGAKNPTISKDRPPQEHHIPESRSQKPESRREERIEQAAAAVARPAALPQSDLTDLQNKLLDACNGALDNPANCSGLLNLSIPQMWMAEGADLQLDILPALRAIGQRDHGKRIRAWAYFTNAVAQAKAARLAGLPSVQPKQSTGTSVGAKLRAMAERQNGGSNV